jgi:hypothetical protein
MPKTRLQILEMRVVLIDNKLRIELAF